MPDIRINLSFPYHRKTKKLIVIGGPEMVLHLIKLWCYAAEHKQNGTLSNMEDLDISLAADYIGTDFVQKVIDAGFIDDIFPRRLHDWKDHQGFIVKAPKRKAHAKRMAALSWESRRKTTKQPPATSNAASNTTSNTNSKEKTSYKQCSSPTPTPNLTLPISKEKSSPEAKKINPDHKAVVEFFCAAYQDKIGAAYAFHGKEDGGKIKTLLSRFNLKQIKYLIDTMFASTDEFYRTGGGYSIGVLLANDNKLVQEAQRKATGADKLNKHGAATAAAAARVLKEMKCQKTTTKLLP